MLLWGEIVNEKILRQSSGNLYHIHFLLYYHQKLKRVRLSVSIKLVQILLCP